MHSVTKDFIQSFMPNPKWLSYGVGNTNIIITAPHGGNMKPIRMPNRKYGVFNRDLYTRRIIERISEVSSPSSRFYLVAADIHRRKVDLNRDIVEGAQGNMDAESYWRSWNALINFFIDQTQKISKKTLYIEFHSHDDNDMIQFGYHLGAKDYVAIKNGDTVKADSTMDELVRLDTRYEHDRYELLFGFESIEARMERLGYKVMVPFSDNSYFNGGRGIKEFSSYRSGVGAMQIELPQSLLKDNWRKIGSDLWYSISCYKRILEDVQSI